MIIYRTSITKNGSDKEYGIDAYDDEKLIKSVCGITKLENDAEKLVQMFNELHIELCHFEDIIEDYLTDFEI